MNSSLMEEERTHAVGRESVGRYFSLAEVALRGVKPENTWFADEACLEFYSKRGWAMSRTTKHAQSCEPFNTAPQCIAPAESKFAHLSALDCGISRSFKQWFKHFLSLITTVMTDENVSGLVKKVWGKGLELNMILSAASQQARPSAPLRASVSSPSTARASTSCTSARPTCTRQNLRQPHRRSWGGSARWLPSSLPKLRSPRCLQPRRPP